MEVDCRLGVVAVIDLVSSTELQVTLGEDRAHTIEHDLIDTIFEVIDAAGGVRVASTGDGAIVLFPSAYSSISSANEIHLRCEELTRTSGVQLELRIGIALGDIEGDWIQPDALQGFAFLLAARLCDAADPRSTLVDDCAYASRRTWSGLHFSAPRELILKGVGVPVRVRSLSGDESASRIPLALASHLGTPMIGRESVMAPATETIGAVTKSSRMIYLQGRGGIGKTRVAAALAELFAERHDVGFGCARQSQAPFDALMQALPADARRELERRPDDEGFAAQAAMFARVQNALDRGERPALLVLDDADHLGRSERALVMFLLDHSRVAHRFILSGRRPLADVDPALYKAGSTVELRLDNLNPSMTRTLVRSLIPPAFQSEAIVSEIATSSEGLPLAVNLLAQATTTRTLSQLEQGPDHGIAGMLSSRLASLSPSAELVIEAAATLDSLEVGLLGVVLDLTPSEVTAAQAEAAQAGILRIGNGTPAFFHDLVRSIIADLVLDEDQWRWHSSAAQWWSESGHNSIRAAVHLLLNGHAAASAKLAACEAAAASAIAAGAYASASEWFERAESFADAPTDSLRVSVRRLGADHLAGASDTHARALGLVDEALVLAEWELGAQAFFAIDRGLFGTAGFSDQQLIRRAEELIAALDVNHPAIPRLRAMVASELTFAAAHHGPRRHRLSRQAIATSRAANDDFAHARVLALCAMALRDPDLLAVRHDVCKELESVASTAQDEWATFLGHFHLASISLELGNLAKADDCLAAAVSSADRLDQPRAQWLVHTMRTAQSIHRGNLETARSLRVEAQRFGRLAGFNFEAHLVSAEQELEIAQWDGSLNGHLQRLAEWAGHPELDPALSGLRYLSMAGASSAVCERLGQTDHGAALGQCPGILKGSRLINMVTIFANEKMIPELQLTYEHLEPYNKTWWQTTVSMGCTSHHLAKAAAILGLEIAEEYASRALATHQPERALLWWTESVLEFSRLGIGAIPDHDVEAAAAVREAMTLPID